MKRAVTAVAFSERSKSIRDLLIPKLQSSSTLDLAKLLDGSFNLELDEKIEDGKFELQRKNPDGSIEKIENLNSDGASLILRISRAQFEAARRIVYGDVDIDQAQSHLEAENKNDAQVYVESTDRYTGLTSYEENINDALVNVKAYLKRASGRVTGMFSRVLKLIFGNLGFKGDDYFKDVAGVLDDPLFTRKFARFHSISKADGKEAGAKYLEEAFKNDKDKNGNSTTEAKQNVAKVASTVLNVFNNIPKFVLDFAPVVFCIQNVTMPWIAKFSPEGGFRNFCRFMRAANPFLEEFCFGAMGLFKYEISGVQRNLSALDSTSAPSKEIEDSKIECETSTIKVTDLRSRDEFYLGETVEEVHQALKRLIGRDSNASALILKGIFKAKGYKDYNDFAEKIIKQKGFITNLYECLKKAKESNGQMTIEEAIDEVFKDTPTQDLKRERIVANFILTADNVACTMPDSLLKTAPKRFGDFYSWAYLFTPILCTVVGEKGFFGKLINILADINPFLNDLFFDLLATFQEELVGIREKGGHIKELMPDFDKIGFGKAFYKVAGVFQSGWNAIRKIGGGGSVETGTVTS